MTTHHTSGAADLPEALRLAAEAVKAWSNVDDFWALPDSDCGEMVLGAIEEGDKYELLTIDADTFGTDGESVKLAQFYAAANPGAVLALLDERDSLRAQLAALAAGQAVAPVTRIPLATGGDLCFEPYVIGSPQWLWALRRDNAFIRYLDSFEQEFVNAAVRAARPAPPAMDGGDADMEAHRKNGLAWAVHRWEDEVKHRPLQNVHRRSLDDAWRQVVRYFGGEPDELLGPCHDAARAAQKEGE